MPAPNNVYQLKITLDRQQTAHLAQNPRARRCRPEHSA